MIVMNVNDKKDQKIDTYPYKGKPYPVKDVWIRWLSRPAQRLGGIRSPLFHHRPEREIPIHNHLYYQTMYILTGHVRCFQHDRDTDKVVGEKVLGPTISSLSHHGSSQYEERKQQGAGDLPVLYCQCL